jgi:hypothetical protein
MAAVFEFGEQAGTAAARDTEQDQRMLLDRVIDHEGGAALTTQNARFAANLMRVGTELVSPTLHFDPAQANYLDYIRGWIKGFCAPPN